MTRSVYEVNTMCEEFAGDGDTWEGPGVVYFYSNLPELGLTSNLLSHDRFTSNPMVGCSAASGQILEKPNYSLPHDSSCHYYR